MADRQQNNRTSTSTQIRNMYSKGMSCMNIKFYNTALAFQLYPYTGKDQNNRDQYDTRNGQLTTVNYEGAYALYQASKDIIDGKVKETNLSVPCNGASLILERKLGMNGQMETIFTITKNNVSIPFKFQTIQQQVKDGGMINTSTIECGLGVFMKTIEGYLNGINADRHLDKLTEDYAKTNSQQQQNPQQQNGGNNNYRNNNNYRRNNNYNNNRRPNNNWNQQPSQNFDSYTIPN